MAKAKNAGTSGDGKKKAVPKGKAKNGMPGKKKDAPGISLEKVVAGIQQMMDSNTVVTHNEKLVDRIGNKRQYDVVIRGKLAGRDILGVIECKDHSVKKGPAAVEAFAKKIENLGANFGLMVSRKGFTDQALQLAKHEHIGCLTLLPDSPEQAGFSIGTWWYGVVRLWTDLRIKVTLIDGESPLSSFDSNKIRFDGKSVALWFIRYFFRDRQDVTENGPHTVTLSFDKPVSFDIEDKDYLISLLACTAVRTYRKKRRFVDWSGEAFYDWSTHELVIPGKATLATLPFETDINVWPDFDGDIPKESELNSVDGLLSAVVLTQQTWNAERDDEVPDLEAL